MNYKEQYSRLNEKLLRQHERVKEGREASAFSLPYLWHCIARQGAYLLWTASLLLIQVLEVAVLAFFHNIYFPPESLFALRLISSVSMLGILFALNSRMRIYQSPEAPTDLKELGPALSPQIRTELLGKIVFLLANCASLLLIVYLTWGTTLHFTSPPIYRAVILSGIIALPWDTLTTFLFYNLGVLKRPVPPRPFRVYSITCYLLALLCLAANLPLLFFIVRVLPRPILTGYLWHHAVGGRLRDLFRFRKELFQREKAFFRAYAYSLGWTFALFSLYEMSLYFLYAPLAIFDPNISLIIFFSHKLIHLGNVFGIKLSLIYLPRLKTSLVIGERRLILKRQRQIIVGMLLYLSLASSFLPLVLMKHEVLMWAAPTGEKLYMGWPLTFILLLLVFFRGAAATLLSWLLGTTLSYRQGLFLAAIILLPNGIWLLSPNFLAAFLPFHVLFGAVLVVDIVSSLFVAIFAFRSAIQQKNTNSGNLTSFPQLCHKAQAALSKSNSQVSLLYLQFWQPIREHMAVVSHDANLKEILIRECVISQWGVRSYWVLQLHKDQTTQDLRERCIEDFGHLLQKIESTKLSNPLDVETFASLLQSNADPYDSLFDAAHGARTTSFSEIDSKDRALLRRLEVMLEGSECSELPPGLTIVERAENSSYWDIPAVESAPQVQEGIRRYLFSLLSSGESINPGRFKQQILRPYCHLNLSGSPAKVITFSPEKRASLHAVRKWAFRRNVADLFQQDCNKHETPR